MKRSETGLLPLVLLLGVFAIVAGLFTYAATHMEEYTDERELSFEAWKGDLNMDHLNELLDEGWRIKAITGDGCCCFEVTLTRKKWRMKK